MIDKKSILKDLQERAALEGGKCLSKEYVNSSTSMLWQCQKGHTWEMSSIIIKQGGWCPACVCKSSRKLNIEQMQELAKSKDGKCLSKEYINIRTKLEWQCKEGHTWMALGSGIKSGTWCPYCAGFAKLTIEEMQQLAIKRGGKCLSKKYINSYTALLWQCDRGHTWKAKPGQVKHGSWCPNCSLNKGSIELMQQIAESRGGKCLSKNYIDNHAHLLWQCEKGHTWKTMPLGITKGSWCPHCAGTARLTIEQMQQWAKSKGGKCLSKTYVNKSTKITWQCKEGHTWEARPNDIQQGYWCPSCEGSLKQTIEQMQVLAKSKGGKCLSTEYINSKTKLSWQCREGHTWETNYAVVRAGNWCSICSGKAKHTIEQMQQWAKKKGGKCLSKEYINNSTKLTWQCKEGHTWEGKPNDIQQGKWCVNCTGLTKGTIEKMQALAKGKGGKCLSTTYINSKEYLTWQCKNSHTWETSPNAIQRGQWCPHCSGRARRTIEEMRVLAGSKGGKCLSKTYINNSTKLTWQCKEGHTWEGKPNHIQQGEWCPECYKLTRKHGYLIR